MLRPIIAVAASAVASLALASGAAASSILPLDMTKTVNAGGATVYLGPAGAEQIKLNTKATVSLSVDGNPLFVGATAALCPLGQLGVLAHVSTTGGPAHAAITIQPLGGPATKIPVTVPALSTGYIGVCADIGL
jgi:hypothetical protein